MSAEANTSSAAATRAVFDRLLAAASGDAVVPNATDEKPRLRASTDERAFAVGHVDYSDDDQMIGPSSNAFTARSGCRSPSPNASSSMSQRNLETILEAIRFLEGDVPCGAISVGGDAAADGNRWRSPPLVRLGGFAQMQRC